MPRRIPVHRPFGHIAPERRKREYGQTPIKKEDDAWYHSLAWRRLRMLKLATDPLCERCKKEKLLVPATQVHHRIERKEAPELALSWDNLESLCKSCHSLHHAKTGRKWAGNNRGGG